MKSKLNNCKDNIKKYKSGVKPRKKRFPRASNVNKPFFQQVFSRVQIR